MEIMPEEDCHKRTYEGYFNYWNETQCDRFSYDLSKEKKVKNHVMCAQNPRTGLGQTTCIGDSGGPLTVKLKSGKHVLVGVAADGYSCGVVSFVQNPEKCVNTRLSCFNVKTKLLSFKTCYFKLD